MDNKNAAMLGECILDMINYCGQLKVVHFLSLKNHNHVIVDEHRIELAEELDEFVEALLGNFTRKLTPAQILFSIKPKPFTFRKISTPAEILDLLDEIEARLKKALSVIQKDDDLSFLADTAMDMVSIITSAKYLINQE